MYRFLLYGWHTHTEAVLHEQMVTVAFFFLIRWLIAREKKSIWKCRIQLLVSCYCLRINCVSKGQQCSKLEKHFYLSISCLTVLYIAFFFARLKINICLWWRLKIFAQANAGRCTDWFAFWRLLSNQRSGILNKPESLVFPGDTKIDLYTSPLRNTISKPV